MAEEEKDDELPKKGGKGLLLIIVLLVVAAAGGGGAYFAMSQGGDDAAEAKKVKKKRAKNGMGPTVPMDVFIVNLDEPGATRYLKVQIVLELDADLTSDERSLQIRLRDMVIMYLSGLTIADVQRATSKQAIKDKIKEFCDEIYGKDRVAGVYFKAFVMQ